MAIHLGALEQYTYPPLLLPPQGKGTSLAEKKQVAAHSLLVPNQVQGNPCMVPAALTDLIHSR